MFLVDSNVWLEILLGQQKAEEAGLFLGKADNSQLHITEFSLYSIALILIRLGKASIFEDFLKDVVLEAQLTAIRLMPDDLITVTKTAIEQSLDFDDAYQYVVAEKQGLVIVSFDHDFDKTARGRVTPVQALDLIDDHE